MAETVEEIKELRCFQGSAVVAPLVLAVDVRKLGTKTASKWVRARDGNPDFVFGSGRSRIWLRQKHSE